MLKTTVIASLFSAATAHQNFHQFWVDGETPGYQAGIRMPPSNSPVTDITSDDIVCNVNGAKVPSGVDTVAAKEGSEIKVQWDQSSHPGPITHMLYGPVDDASQATGIGAGWFKIDEQDYVDGKWANEIMEADNMTHTFTLPKGLASGEYLLRSEMLALHAAQTVGGAQFYIGCAQLKITGTGSTDCSPKITLPGAYKDSDSNIYIPNFYNGFKADSYKAPGGDVATCGAGSGGSNPQPAPTSSARPTSSAAPQTTLTSSAAPKTTLTSSAAPQTTLTTKTSSSAASAPTSSPGGVALYGQCGGIGYTGETNCASGAKCVKQNDYYSQCVSA
ncbi:glycosyl hydrolase family 61-domain-containing protein [Apiospora aurea]|uniref:lytic cellulose monooxygenase (C4-dehydrogenating) n=1 Tax=Apiospora aurea TaxID=335848 RepID=A0ABR1Q7Y7_9PEZI